MIVIFESILPIFLIVLLGAALKRAEIVDQGLWRGLEQLGYYVLFPSLLFLTLYRADFSGLTIGAISLAAVASLIGMSLAVFALWPALKSNGVTPGAFTTIFQTSTRWNAFIALAVAEKMFGAPGLAVVALVMALIVIPINFLNISILIVYGGGERTITAFIRKLMLNPLILGCVTGIVMRFVPFGVYPPVEEAIRLVAGAALSLGLLMVGAGLRVRDALRPRPIVFLPVALKLCLFPLLIIASGLIFSVEGDALVMLALCGSVPTALNGYLLAREMGGDAPLYATVATWQTVASFFTMPIALGLAAQFSG